MKGKIIICPVCGNEVMAKATKEKQRCRWCGRKFKIKSDYWNTNNWEIEATQKANDRLNKADMNLLKQFEEIELDNLFNYWE